MRLRSGLLGVRRGSAAASQLLQLSLLLALLPAGTVRGQGFNTSLVYVGGTVPQWGSNPDIGAQINTAYGLCPSTGCTIVLVPKADGSCYDYNVPITFITVGKYALLQGGGPTAESAATSGAGVIIPGNSGGSCLNFTPTTVMAAMTFDYASFLGGGYSPAHGIRDIILQNNNCKTLGGCNSHAIGIKLGGSNSGAQNGEIANVRVNGFGIGISFVEGATESWGVVLRGLSIVENTIGINFAGSLENISFFGGRVAGNNIGFSIVGNADVYVYGVSIDSNITAGTKATSGIFSCINCHWENLSNGGSITTHYFIGSGAASLVIEGGKAIDNISSGPDVDFWFSNSGISTYIHGLLVYSPGRKATQVVQSINPCTWWISIFNDSPSVLTKIAGGPSQQGVLFPNDFNSGVSSMQTQFVVPNLGLPFAPSNVQLSPGWGSSAFVDYSFGTTQRFSFVAHAGGSGKSANPTMHVTFPQTWPATPFYVCKVVGGTGGAGAPLTGEATASTTNMTLVFNGTAAEGVGYQIQCVGE
jgi:hypothetical protein